MLEVHCNVNAVNHQSFVLTFACLTLFSLVVCLCNNCFLGCWINNVGFLAEWLCWLFLWADISAKLISRNQLFVSHFSMDSRLTSLQKTFGLYGRDHQYRYWWSIPSHIYGLKPIFPKQKWAKILFFLASNPFLTFPHEKTTFQWSKVVSEAVIPTN